MFSKYYNKFCQPYIVAEIGVNHGANLNLAKKQILLAKKSGANAVKFQTYKAKNIASKKSLAYWDLKKEKTKSQYELFRKYDHFDKEDYITLQKFSKKNKIDFSSTPFDLDCVNYLKKIVNFFKIASADITNFPLIEKVAKTKLQMIISTGASNIDEIHDAVKLIKKYNKKKIVIMHCTLSYPTSDKDANLGAIHDLKKNFPKEFIGYSDHTKPDKDFDNVSTSYLLGARVIEKHFTHNKKIKGNDHYHSMDSKDLIKLRKKILKIINISGVPKKKVLKCEVKSRLHARRSLVLKKDISKDKKILLDYIDIKRPGTGISPKYLKKVLGKKINKSKKQDDVVFWRDIQR